MFKIVTSITVFMLLLTTSLYSQMTTIYESGNNTPVNISTDFGSFSNFSTNIFPPPTGQTSYTDIGKAVEYVFEYPGYDDGIFILYRTIPAMAQYTSLQFYIEYVKDPTSNVSLMLSDNNNTSTIPNSSGNIVSSNVISSAMIPYNNSNADSIIKIELVMNDVDSTVFRLDYIRVLADLSSTVGISESDGNDQLSISSLGNTITILNKQNKMYNLKIFSMSGQEVYRNTITGSTNINIPHVSKGLYIVYVSNSESIHTHKVCLNN